MWRHQSWPPITLPVFANRRANFHCRSGPLDLNFMTFVSVNDTIVLSVQMSDWIHRTYDSLWKISALRMYMSTEMCSISGRWGELLNGTFIRLRRLQWVGHVMKMKVERVTKKAQKGYIEGRRPVGRPWGRWIVAVVRDGKRTFADHCHRVETQLQ